jgi:CDP-diacylglycerol--glycerol-3-phosphate 3-phosphatidyltransferase
MKPSFDLLASELLGICCACLLLAHRVAGAPNGYHRVVQQGATFFLGFNLMHAGYWMLQPAVRRCTRIGLSPAVISWLSLVPAIAAAIAVSTGHWGYAAWLLLVSALLDVLDGAVARAGHHASPAGAVLDSVLDRYAEFIFFAGLLVFYREHVVAQLVVLAALLGSFLVTYSTAKAEALDVTPPRGWMKRSDRLSLMIVGTALEPFSLHWFESGSTTLAWPVLVAIGIIAVLGNASAIIRFTALARQAGAWSPGTGSSRGLESGDSQNSPPLHPAGRVGPVRLPALPHE